VCIYGSSKQGKTALRKKYISKNESLVVVCNPEWSCNDIFAAILRAAECVIVRDPNDPTGAQATATILDKTIPINLGDVADVLRVLSEVFTGNYIVIEEFHYLPEKTQLNFAFKLKAVLELSDRHVFIIVGVWLEKNRMAYLNKDLSGRVVAINADEWSESDLLQVILFGEQKLNITFPFGFVETLVKRSCGSVFLVREACYRACTMRGIFKPERDRRMLEDSLDVSTILKDIADTGGDYPGQIISLLGIENIQLNEQEKQAGLKDWVLRMLVLAPPAEMQKGIPLDKLRRWICDRHPTNYNPSVNQIERIIKAVQSVQLTKAGHSLFDYDRQQKTVRCVDKGLVLWRANTKLENVRNLVFH
jgi:hypothetical protein